MRKYKINRSLLYAGLGCCLCQSGLIYAGEPNVGPQPIPIVKGVYRLPFANGTDVFFSNNHTNHPARLNEIDMSGIGSPTTVVSAAAGWIRVISENNDTKCPSACGSDNNCDNSQDGSADNAAAQTAACDGYTGPSSFCCEKDIEDNGGSCPNGGTCKKNPDSCNTNAPNNFVWIEHANGEWSKYSHMLFGSVGQGTDNFGNLGAGHFVGEWVAAGTPLGIEGDVGFASGPHVHFEIDVFQYVERTEELEDENLLSPDPELEPDELIHWLCSGFIRSDGIDDDVLYEDKDNDGDNDPDDDVNRQNRIAVFCEVGFPIIADTREAGPCDDTCGANPANLVVQGTFTANNTPKYDQSSGLIGNDFNDLVIQPYAGVSIRGGDAVILTPGFHAELNSFFAASVGNCDSPGGTGE